MPLRDMDKDEFDGLRTQLIDAAVRCSNGQLLDLADTLHAVLRLRRRRHVLREPASFDASPVWLDDERHALL